MEFIVWIIVFVSVVLNGLFAFEWYKARRRLTYRTKKLKLQIEDLDQKILQAKKQIETTFDSIADGIVVIDTSFTITRINKAYAGFVNKPIASILLNKCHKVLRNLDQPCPECPINNIRYHEGFNCFINSKHFQIEVKSHENRGTVVSYIETIRDVTRYEELQSQLRRKERLASIGIMVAGIAHEMNNPLSGITGNSQLMMQFPEKYGLNEKGASRITTIFESANKASKIMDDLLNFSSPSNLHFEPIELGIFTKQWMDSLPSTVVAQMDLVPNDTPLRIWGHREHLHKAFTKVLDNSMQAIEERKKREGLLEGKIRIYAEDVGTALLWCCEDNGIGLAPENLEKVFEPFYTTKEPGKGVGLGLSICHRIMAQHFGTITLSNLTQGVRAELKFPRERPN